MTRLAIAGSVDTAAYASAARALDGWEIVAVGGGGTDSIARANGLGVMSADDVLDRCNADIIVVGTERGRRFADSFRVARRGIGVIAIPDEPVFPADYPHMSDLEQHARRFWCSGVPLTASPAVQAFLHIVASSPTATRLSGSVRTSPRPDGGHAAHSFDAMSTLVSAGRLAGWGPVDGFVSARPNSSAPMTIFFDQFGECSIYLTNSFVQPGERPEWVIQAAGAGWSLRIEMLPTPTIEFNGELLGSTPTSATPGERFGFDALLTTFARDLLDGRAPMMGIEHDERFTETFLRRV